MKHKTGRNRAGPGHERSSGSGRPAPEAPEPDSRLMQSAQRCPRCRAFWPLDEDFCQVCGLGLDSAPGEGDY